MLNICYKQRDGGALGARHRADAELRAEGGGAGIVKNILPEG